VLNVAFKIQIVIVSKVIRKHGRTNLFVMDPDMWNWAQYRAKTLGYASVSEYIFDLIKIDREQTVLRKKPDKK